MEGGIESILGRLADKGVKIIDPRQTWISEDVDINRIYKDSVLFPGTRLTGERTLIGSYAKIGSEGPAVIQDSIIGARAEVASGFLSESTMLPCSRAGANSHFRAGTLLEEESSTAHSVGLKQSILMYSVTLGSLINICDVLISGGRSRHEHTEIGSGFIHFNFTPWGKSGDKATPSLIGNVTDGVFLDQERIFLGGLSGLVGPQSIGYGATTVAGQVIRKAVAGWSVHSEANRDTVKTRPQQKEKRSHESLRNICDKNIGFIAQLYALKGWYSQIRLRRSHIMQDQELSLILAGAIDTIQVCIHERIARYNSFAEEWMMPRIDEPRLNDIPLETKAAPDWKPDLDHIDWVRGLTAPEKSGLRSWLNGITGSVTDTI